MSTLDYRDFLADTPRVDAYRRAIEATVSEGQVVLDVGTGIGTYAMFAARAGARVLAVEMDPVIDMARELAAQNGLADRIVFMRGQIEELVPPESADVLVFEDFSPFLYHSDTARILEVVMRRWLKPSATSIPRSLRAFMAPVSSPAAYDAITPWVDGTAFGFDMSRFSRQLLNDLHAVVFDPSVFVADPVEVGRAELLSTGPFGLDAAVSWQAYRAVELHGLALWIDLDLADGVIFSNAPKGHSTGWDQRFLPLAEPLQVQAGATIEAQVRTLGPSPREPEWWSWRVKAGGHEQEMDTFRGVPLSLAQLKRASLDNRPLLTARGQIRLAVLELMDGQHTIVQIAGELRERFPELLSTDAEACRAVARELDLNEHPAATQAPHAP